MKKIIVAAALIFLFIGCTYAGYHGESSSLYTSRPGLIGPEMVYGPMYYNPAPKPISQDEALRMVGNYLANSNNPNLRIGKPQDRGDAFEIPIVTTDGSLTDIFVVDKFSGWIKSIYR